MSDENKGLVRRALEEVFAGGDLAAVDDIFHRDYVNHEAGPRTPAGPEGLKVTVTWLRAAFSDLHYDIQDEVDQDDKVVVRLISSGRHTGAFLGFQPSGKQFAVEQIHIYRIADGKIIEHWSTRDDLGQGIQLGLISIGERPGARARLGTTTPRPEAVGQPPGRVLVKSSDVPVGGGMILRDDQAIVTQPEPGVFKAFTSTCTHLGCTVSQVADGAIKCPCHGSEFSVVAAPSYTDRPPTP